jgi:hypothetical protein
MRDVSRRIEIIAKHQRIEKGKQQDRQESGGLLWVGFGLIPE